MNVQVTGKVAIAVDEDAIEADKVLDQPIAPFIPDVSRLRKRRKCVVITNAPYDSGLPHALFLFAAFILKHVQLQIRAAAP